MNILHIGKYYPPFHGGMENYLCDLAYAQAQQNHDVKVWVHNHKWGLVSSDSVESLDGQIKLVRQKSLKPMLFTPIMLGFKKRLKGLLQAKKIDVIHLHWPNPSLFWLLLYKLDKSIPVVISWHSDMVTEHSSWLLKTVYRVIKPLETRLLKRANSVLVSTQNYADYSQQLIKFVDKVEVIPLGLRTDKIIEQGEIKQHETWQEDWFKVFNLGRFTFYKNQQFLINVLPNLPNSQLIIAGNGQLKNKLQASIDKHQTNDRVTLLTERSWEQVHELFRTCDLFCMASDDRAESFGVVLLEAMFHDKIILVPDTCGSGMQWLAENYQKGFVYESNNEADFINKVKSIQRDFELISARPKQFDYDINAIAERIEQHYLNLINRRTP